MENPDIANHLNLLAAAREIISGLQLDNSRVYASLPEKTLLLDFIGTATGMTTEQMKRKFALTCSMIAERSNNNPMAFDWYALALAVDSIHGHTSVGIEEMLNTR